MPHIDCSVRVRVHCILYCLQLCFVVIVIGGLHARPLYVYICLLYTLYIYYITIDISLISLGFRTVRGNLESVR